MIFGCLVLLLSFNEYSVHASSSYDVNNPHIVINQIYGAGDAGLVSHSFIELYNPTENDINISGWSLHYRASSGDSSLSWSSFSISDNTTIPSHKSYLVRCNHDGKTSVTTYKVDLSDGASYDAEWNIDINTKGCAVVLCKETAQISEEDTVFDNVTAKPSFDSYVDMLAVSGNDASPEQIISWYEKAALSVQSKKKGIRRKDFTDTDDNSSDAEEANYDKGDIEKIRPRSLTDGAWGMDNTAQLRKEVESLLQLTAYDEVYCASGSAITIKSLRSEAQELLDNEQAVEADFESLINRLESAREARVFNYLEDVTQVYITTDNGQGGSYNCSLTKPMGYVGAQIIVVKTDGSVMAIDDTAQIKVRGNSTAEGDKKPYNIKFSSKKDLFEFGASKKWTLLADWYDPTLMRNFLSLDFSQKIGNLVTMDHTPVEVWVDGQYQGLYLLTEKIEADKNRVDINVKKTGQDFLVEIDDPSRVEEGNIYFYSDKGIFFRLREPEDISEEKLNIIQSKMNELHSTIASGDYGSVEQLIDVDSFVAYYLLNEYLRTWDFGGLSVFLYFKDGKFYAGPGWDYDLSSGFGWNYVRTSSWEAHAANCHYYVELMKYPQFVAAVYQKSLSIKSSLNNIYKENGWIDAYLSNYGDAAKRNWDNAPVAYRDLSYDEQVSYLRNWLSERDAWMSWYLKKLATGESDALHVNEVPATCTKNGTKEYYTVDNCGHIFSDKDCTKEVTLDSLVIPASHTEEIDVAVVPTYDSKGYTEGKHCSVCGDVIIAQQEIPALKEAIIHEPSAKQGLVYLGENQKLVNPGETTLGYFKYGLTLSLEDAPLEYSKEIPAVKDAGTYYVWYIFADDTVIVRSYIKPVVVEISKSTTLPNKPDSKITVDFSIKSVSEVLLPTGWAWSESDRDKVLVVGTETNAIAEYVDSDKANYKDISVTVSIVRSDCTHTALVKTDALAATCTKEGNTEYWTCSICSRYFSDANGQSEIVNGSWVTEKAAHVHAAAVIENEVAPTCETDGSYDEVVYCENCLAEISRTTKTVTALGHKYGEPVYVWSEDHKTCTATAICLNDASHIATETAEATSRVKTEATETEKGTNEYTAVFKNALFTTQVIDVVEIPVLEKGDDSSNGDLGSESDQLSDNNDSDSYSDNGNGSYSGGWESYSGGSGSYSDGSVSYSGSNDGYSSESVSNVGSTGGTGAGSDISLNKPSGSVTATGATGKEKDTKENNKDNNKDKNDKNNKDNEDVVTSDPVVTQNEDGSETTTVIAKGKDGSETTTSVTKGKDGSETKVIDKKNTDGSTSKNTIVTSTEGKITDTKVTVTNTGSTITEIVEKEKDGTESSRTKEEISVNKKGTKKTTSVTIKADGSSENSTEKVYASGTVSMTKTVKDAKGNTTKTSEKIRKTKKGNTSITLSKVDTKVKKKSTKETTTLGKVTIYKSGKVKVTLTITNAKGKTKEKKYTLKPEKVDFDVTDIDQLQERLL